MGDVDPDTERIPFHELTEEDLEDVYDDLDRYEEVVGDMNETVIGLIRQLARARQLHQTNCLVAKRMVSNSYPCAMCEALADQREQT